MSLSFLHFNILAGTNNIKARTYSAMLRVAGHELTHFIQNRSPTKYNTLKRETLDFLKSEKSDYTEWLREEIRKKQEANAPFGKMTVEQATDEIVSDAFESVLANEEFITRLYASDAGLTKQVNNWANKYYKQFSEGLKSAFVTDELTEAGKIMRAAGERAQKVYEHWIDAFAHATRNALLFEPQAELIRNMVREVETEKEKYDKPLSMDDVYAVHSIGDRKPVNEFTAEDMKKAAPWAYKLAKSLEGINKLKSPFFRKWFGEWRAHEKSKITITEFSTETSANAGNAVNRDIDRKVSWSRNFKRETKVHAVKDKVSIEAANSIKGIIENAVFLDATVCQHTSMSKLSGTAFMHRAYTIYRSNNKLYLLKLFIEEAISSKSIGESFFRAYQLKDIEKVASIPNSVLSENGGLTGEMKTTTYSVADLYKFVKTYDKDFIPAHSVSPEALNPDGTPKVFFHGTRSEFDEFLKSAAGRSSI